MKKNSALLVCFFLVLFTAQTKADVINFDDLHGSFIPANYKGFTWDSLFRLIQQDNYQNAFGNTYSFPSSPNAAFNGDGVLSITLTASSPFDFEGAWFTAWAYNNSVGLFCCTATAVKVLGYNGATLIGTASMALPTDRFAWLGAGFLGVDRLVFENEGIPEKWWLMDDFTYNNSNSVPEPGSLLLLGIGLSGIALVAWRRRK
jgi:hypothetical protein